MGCDLLKKYGSCNKCMEGAPFHFCCRKECGEHEFCAPCIALEREKQIKRLENKVKVLEKEKYEREHKSSA